MTSTIDKAAVYEAYEDVRNDASETAWAVLAYDNKNIVVDSTGTNYDEFKNKFTDDVRLYGFVRVNTGDELSRRTKFVLISWVGNNVSAIKRAKMSTDKAVVKSVIQNVAIEVQAHESEELEEESIKDALRRAGGANYGTGIRPE